MVSALAEIIFLCGNNVSVKTMSLKSIGLFCSKNTLRILPYLGTVKNYAQIYLQTPAE